MSTTCIVDAVMNLNKLADNFIGTHHISSTDTSELKRKHLKEWIHSYKVVNKGMYIA